MRRRSALSQRWKYHSSATSNKAAAADIQPPNSQASAGTPRCAPTEAARKRGVGSTPARSSSRRQAPFEIGRRRRAADACEAPGWPGRSSSWRSRKASLAWRRAPSRACRSSNAAAASSASASAPRSQAMRLIACAPESAVALGLAVGRRAAQFVAHARQLGRVGQDAQAHPVVLLLAVGRRIGFVAVQLLRGDHRVAHAGHFGNGNDAPLAVGQAPDLHDEVQRAGDLPAQAVLAALEAGESRQHFDPVQAFARRVGVDRGHGPFVPGVHGLQHVHHFGAAHLAHHHAVGPHAQAVADQVAG